MEEKKRTYRAKVKLTLAGAKKPRYLSSQRQAIQLYRDINLRLMQAGRPPRAGSMEAVRGWQGLIEPCSLTVSAAGGVVVRRAANEDDFKAVAAPIWPGVQP